MGWTGVYTERTPKEYWKEVFIPEYEHWDSKTPNRMKIVAQNNYGSEFYAAVKDSVRNVVFGLVVLIHSEDGEIVYKEMTDSCGPCYYHVSAKVLNALSDTDDEYSREWREKCREELQKKKTQRMQVSSLKQGDKVRFHKEYVVNNVPCREFMLVDKKNGIFRAGLSLYRLHGWKSQPFDVITG